MGCQWSSTKCLLFYKFLVIDSGWLKLTRLWLQVLLLIFPMQTQTSLMKVGFCVSVYHFRYDTNTETTQDIGQSPPPSRPHVPSCFIMEKGTWVKQKRSHVPLSLIGGCICSALMSYSERSSTMTTPTNLHGANKSRGAKMSCKESLSVFLILLSWVTSLSILPLKFGKIQHCRAFWVNHTW